MRNVHTISVLVLLAVACVASGCSAHGSGELARGDLTWVEDFNAGLEQAKREGKPAMVFFTASWCGYCHQLADESFTNRGVVDLSKRFVCILVDADQNRELVQKFEVGGFPTVVFLSPDGEPIGEFSGKRPTGDVLAQMQAALQSVAGRDESSVVR